MCVFAIQECVPIQMDRDRAGSGSPDPPVHPQLQRNGCPGAYPGNTEQRGGIRSPDLTESGVR